MLENCYSIIALTITYIVSELKELRAMLIENREIKEAHEECVSRVDRIVSDSKTVFKEKGSLVQRRGGVICITP